MNRFFSKLDLRDIKINPSGNAFPPDEDLPEALNEPVEEAPAVEVAKAPDIVPAEVQATEEPSLEASPEGEDSYSPSSDVLKVSARSRPSAVAGAIAGVVRESGRA
jgi:stage V sporulation protein S